MCRLAWVPIVLALAAPSSALAQDPLTLDRAVQAVLARNAQIAESRADAAGVRAGADAAGSAAYPRISFSESWQRANEPVFVFGSLLSARRFSLSNLALDALNHPPATSAFRSTLAVDQILFDGGRQRADGRAARRQADAARLMVDVRTADLVVSATATFGRMLTAQATERAADAGLASAREDRGRAERRRDAGMATDADVLALGVHVADLEQRRIQARGDLAIAIAELNRLMGEPIERVWQAVDAVEHDAPVVPPLAELLTAADAARPEIGRATALQEAAAETQHSASRLLIPQAGVQAAVDFAGTEFGQRASSWIAGAEFRWTLSTGGAELARRRAATEELTRARAATDDTRAAVHVDVVTAFRRLETAQLRRAATRSAIAQARESQRIVRDRFDAGLATVNDVLRASTDLLDAESNDVAARVETLVGTAALARAVGRVP